MLPFIYIYKPVKEIILETTKAIPAFRFFNLPHPNPPKEGDVLFWKTASIGSAVRAGVRLFWALLALQSAVQAKQPGYPNGR